MQFSNDFSNNLSDSSLGETNDKTVLDELIEASKISAEKRSQIISQIDLNILARSQRQPIDVLPILLDRSKVNIIAEIKRSSPSAGEIAKIVDPTIVAKEYERGGASIISVLTEETKFSGSLADLKSVRRVTELPILRKDFITTEYQVLESRAYGADLILLIASAFEYDKNGGTPHFRSLFDYARELGMRVLVECHNLDEIKIARSIGAKIIGINVRNLKDFSVNTELFKELAVDLPGTLQGTVAKVAESGVKSIDDFIKYVDSGANAVLIGECLAKATDRTAILSDFVNAGIDYITNPEEYKLQNSSTMIPIIDRNLDNGENGSEYNGEIPLSVVEGPYFGQFGGRFVPEALVNALDELETMWNELKVNSNFQNELHMLFKEYVGRPSLLTEVPRFASVVGQTVTDRLTGEMRVNPRIFLKREDLNHTGAHKINNAIGQALIAKHLGKKRIIAETGAGQHGVATATVCALLGLECEIYMGEVDVKRQALNVARMKLLGAKVNSVKNGDGILKDAINEALRDWVTNVSTTHYLLGTVAGPHPFPTIVRDLQQVIGIEAKAQLKEKLGDQAALPDAICACVGGGSNALGIFNAFLDDKDVELFGFEAGGDGIETGKHATRFASDFPGAKNPGSIGIFQGAKSYLLQDENGQTLETHSISAGLDYASIGPEHPFLKEIGRVKYNYATDKEAMDAFEVLCKTEGIIPALESSHALAGAYKACFELAINGNYSPVIIVNLSGRGDKDVVTAGKWFNFLKGEDGLLGGGEYELS